MLHPVLFHVTVACVGSVFKLCFYVSWCSILLYHISFVNVVSMFETVFGMCSACEPCCKLSCIVSRIEVTFTQGFEGFT